MARKKLPYYPLYPSDFDADENIRGMDDAELGFFIRCLNHAWVNRGLPADPEEIDRVIPGRRAKPFAETWTRVSRSFVPSSDGRLVNPRQEAERSEIAAKVEVSTKRIQKRWEKQNPCNTGNADSCNTQVADFCNSNQNQNQNHTPIVPYAADAAPEQAAPKPDYAAIWQAFDRCKSLHPNCTDPDLAAQMLISLVDAGKVTAADAAEMEPGMRRWLDSQEWSPDNHPERYSPTYKRFSQWVALMSWRGRPAPSEAAKVARRTAEISSDGTDPFKVYRPDWLMKEGAA